MRIRQTLTTVHGALVFDTTKTNKSRRRISLKPATVAALRSHRARHVRDLRLTIAITLDTYSPVVGGMDADAVADQIFKKKADG